MRIVCKSLGCIALLCLLCGCHSNRKGGAEASDGAAPARFPMPEVPVMLTDPEKRTEYVAAHYWDKFDFTDTAYLNKPEVTEQGMADYLNILRGYVKPDQASASLGKLLAGASADTAMFRHITDLLEKYLYDPNSPMRDEELYIPVLRYLVASPQLDSLSKLRPRSRLEMALKNRPGAQAADFAYTVVSGRTARMHGLKADYTILFFNNPGCPACGEILAQMTASPEITARVADGRLKVLALYPDADLKAWREHAEDFPATWIDAYDQGQTISKSELYDLKAIPTLYLLDRDKRVLLKDAPFGQVEAYLAQQQK